MKWFSGQKVEYLQFELELAPNCAEPENQAGLVPRPIQISPPTGHTQYSNGLGPYNWPNSSSSSLDTQWTYAGLPFDLNCCVRPSSASHGDLGWSGSLSAATRSFLQLRFFYNASSKRWSWGYRRSARREVGEVGRPPGDLGCRSPRSRRPAQSGRCPRPRAMSSVPPDVGRPDWADFRSKNDSS